MPITNTLSTVLEARFGQFRREVDKTNGRVKDFAKNNRTLGDVVSNMKKAILNTNPVIAAMGVAAVAAAAGLIKLTTSAVNTADAMSKLAQATGTNTEFLSRLSFVADQSGTSLNALAPVFRRLARFQEEALKGSKGVIADFERLGITVEELRGAGIEDLFLNVAEGFRQLPTASEKTAIGFKLIADNIQELTPLLDRGSEGIREMMTRADELGLTISTKFGKQSEEFNDTIDLIRKAFLGLKRRLAVVVLPILADLGERFLILATEVLPKVSASLLQLRFSFADVEFQVARLIRILDAVNKVGSDTVEESDSIAEFWKRAQERGGLLNSMLGDMKDQLVGTKGQFIALKDAIAFSREEFIEWRTSLLEGATEGGALEDLLGRLTDGLTGIGIAAATAAEKLEALIAKGQAFGPQLPTFIESLGKLIEAPGAKLERLIEAGLAVGPRQGTEQEAFQAGLGPLLGDQEEAEKNFGTLKTAASGLGNAMIAAARGAEGAFRAFFKQFFVDIAAAIARAVVLAFLLRFTPLGGAFSAIQAFAGQGFDQGGFGGGGILGRALPVAAGIPGGGGGAAAAATPAASSNFEVRPIIEIRDSSPLVIAEHVDTQIVPRFNERKRDGLAGDDSF